MDESRTLEALFPGSRHNVLAALFAEPHRWWTLDELAGRAGVRPGAVLPQLLRLRKSGIVLRIGRAPVAVSSLTPHVRYLLNCRPS